MNLKRPKMNNAKKFFESFFVQEMFLRVCRARRPAAAVPEVDPDRASQHARTSGCRSPCLISLKRSCRRQCSTEE